METAKSDRIGRTPPTSVRILHVEDNPRDAELMRETLAAEDLDCELFRVESREDYIAALERGGFDLIVCDYTLPSFQGGEALKIAAAMCPQVPFLFFSGTIGEEMAVEALKSGATEYVLKNSLARLPSAVRRALREAGERSDREKAEAALRASEERYRRLFERNLAGVFRSTAGGRILECNQAFARMFGYHEPGQLSGVRASDLYVEASERDGFLERLRVERTIVGFETRFRRRDGSFLWALENVTLLEAGTGEEEVLEGTMIDITERKNLEEEFRQAQKMEAVGRLAGGVAHDFNNILTAILGYSDLLGASLAGNAPLQEEVEEIRKAAERAATLTRQLLAFSRRQVLLTEVLDLNVLVRELERMLRRVIGEDIRIVTLCEPSLGRVRADRGQLEQVVMNLVVNARDAMPGGGTLTIETRHGEIDEAYAREHSGVQPGDAVMLAVSDTGMGMDEETKSHIFEPFYTTKEKGKGTGLGLATVYGIVQQSGGHIFVYSEPGHGTTFKIYLPRVAAAEDVAPRGAAAVVGGTETVLLVEHDDAVRRLAREALDPLGYVVLDAEHGERGLQIAREHAGPIHLLLTDVVMPGLSGPSLVASLAKLRPGIPVLYMSGYTESAAVRIGVLEAGMALLQKPFGPTELARRVRQSLDGAG